MFSYSFTSYYVLNEYNLELVLPKGFGITQKDVNTVSPPSSRIFSDGQQIILEWNEVLEYLEDSNYLVFFERIAFSNFSPAWSILFFIIGGGVGSVCMYYFLKRKRKDIVTMALTRDEKLVVDYVLNNNDVFQNEVGKKYTDITGETGGLKLRVDYGQNLVSKELSDGSVLHIHVYDYESSRSGCLGLFGNVKHSYKIHGFKVKDNIVTDWAYGLYKPAKKFTHIFGFVLGYDSDEMLNEIKNEYANIVKTSTNEPISSWD